MQSTANPEIIDIDPPDPILRSIDGDRFELVEAYSVKLQAQQDLRPQVLDFVLKWQDACRAHPIATIYIVP